MSPPLLAGTLLALLAVSERTPDQDRRFSERVDVERVVVDARVVDPAGSPIRGLGPSDFRVRVDGAEVPLESVQWISATAASRREAAAEPSAPPSVPQGRLLVFLFQKSFEHTRLWGLLRMQAQAAEFLRTLTPEDRVAVLVHDTHLRLCQDFTGDHDALREAIEHGVLALDRWDSGAGSTPSLAAQLSREAGRRAASLEHGMLVLGRALNGIPGPKTVVLFGWGLGRFSASEKGDPREVNRSSARSLESVSYDRRFAAAVAALAEARASVIALDVTSGEGHSLESGLMDLAAWTGGYYSSTDVFPERAMKVLGRVLAGHYVLSFEKPSLPAGAHRIEVELVGRKGSIMARPFYVG